MRYIKPHYYDQFRCTADKCPDTCCAGWQIMIDEDALEKYSKVKGEFGNRLYHSIDWDEGAFLQKDWRSENVGKNVQSGEEQLVPYPVTRRCSFLNERNLCDLYQALGEDALCQTCQRYPRHEEEFEGVREWSLSLSCPVAARMILECEEPVRFLEEEDEKPEPLEEEFEDFDFLLFTQLEDARGVVLAMLQDRSLPSEKRMGAVLKYAEAFQSCIDEERYCDVDEVTLHYKEMWNAEEKNRKYFPGIWDGKENRYAKMNRTYKVLCRLERLREEWSEVLDSAGRVLYGQGEEAYYQLCQRFEEEWGMGSSHEKEWERLTEQLLVFFVYTYFCGAVYDDWIYSKLALSVFSVCWIRELLMARWAQQGKLSWEDCIELSYRYAREIEHSDLNLDTLEEWLQDKGW